MSEASRSSSASKSDPPLAEAKPISAFAIFEMGKNHWASSFGFGALLFGRGVSPERDNHADTQFREEGCGEALWSSYSSSAHGEMAG